MSYGNDCYGNWFTKVIFSHCFVVTFLTFFSGFLQQQKEKDCRRNAKQINDSTESLTKLKIQYKINIMKVLVVYFLKKFYDNFNLF